MIFHKDGEKPIVSPTGEIFVFGSNLAGIHGAGAAREALVTYGAIFGRGLGFVGQSYALPTKNHLIDSMDFKCVKMFIEMFTDFSRAKRHEKFFVTAVGTGLAGYKDSDIAPLFKGVGNNCNMPIQWKEYLEN